MAGSGASPINNLEVVKRLKLGLLLKSMREEAGRTQRDSSIAIGYANATFVCNVEKGANNIPIGKVIDFAKEYCPSDYRMLSAAIIQYVMPEVWNACIVVIPFLTSGKEGKIVSKEVNEWINNKFIQYGISFE